jgi:hypothetical protein
MDDEDEYDSEAIVLMLLMLMFHILYSIFILYGRKIHDVFVFFREEKNRRNREG